MTLNHKKFFINQAWLTVILLWVIALLNYLDRLMITSMRDPIIRDIPMTDAQFGLLTSVFLWVYGLGSPFMGFLADKFNKKLLIFFSLIIWSTVTLMMGIVHDFSSLLILRAVMGLSEACYIPAALALIVDFHKPGTRSLATGIHMSGLYTGSALGGIGGYIAENPDMGWRYGFHLLGIIGIVYAFIVLILLKNKKEEIVFNQQSTATISSKNMKFGNTLLILIKTRAFNILLFYFALLGISFWTIYAWLPTYLRESFNLSLGKAGISATMYIQIASFIGVLAGGVLADKWIKTNIRGRIFLPFIGFLCAAPCLYFMTLTSVLFMAIFSLIIFGLARGFSDANVMPILCQVVEKKYRATGYGILNLLSTIVGGIMIYVGGKLKDMNFNLGIAFQIAALAIFLAAIFIFFIKPKTQE